MKKIFLSLLIVCISILVIFTGTSFIYADTTVNYGNKALSGGSQSGNFSDEWDLTKGDLVISFTYDANGLVDDSGAHAWAELGIRDLTTTSNFNPPSGTGVWLATDYDWTVNTFDPDVSATLDLDDKLLLQRQGGNGEGAYNLPSVPPAPGNNHRFWWDRDGVDPYQNSETANTGGIYNIVITLHATSTTSGTAYMNIRSLNQGFETDGNWGTIELTPAGMTFTGNMEKMRIFYGLYGYGATHSVAFNGIIVTGSLYWTEVSIDIKPGEGDSNSINLKAKGVVPVAVLSTEDFDAATIDTDTVMFAGASPVKYLSKDVNSDGLIDMLFHFNIKDLDLDGSSTSATLIGDTIDGKHVKGTETITIVKS